MSMKKIVFFSMLFLINSSMSSEHRALDSLEDLKWQHRIIVFATKNGDPAINDFKQYADAINDRDIVWLILQEDRLLSNYAGPVSESLLTTVRTKYALADHNGVLIGKDGGVKARFDALDLQSLFQKIDAMPMRQAEIKRSKPN